MLSSGPPSGSSPGLTERCVTTAFRRGGPPSKNLVDSGVRQNNRFLAVMHAAAVVLLIYQRTRNVWRRLWEVESGQMSAPGQVGVAASQLLLTLTILSPLPLCFSNVDQRSMNSFTCILCYLQLCTDKSNASLGAARLRSWILAWACLDQRGWRWGRCDIQLDKGQKHDLRNMQSVPKLEGEVSLEL